MPEPVTRFGSIRSTLALSSYFAVFPLAAIGGGLLLAPWMTVCALFATPTRFDKALWRAAAPVMAAVAIFALIVAISAAWSPITRWDQSAKIIGALGFGCLFAIAAASLSDRGRQALGWLSLVAGFVLLAFVAVEALLDMPMNRWGQPQAEAMSLMRNPGRGVAALTAIAFGIVAANAHGGSIRRALLVVFLAGVGAASLQFDMSANLAGFGAGFLTFLLGLLAPSFVLGAVVGAVVVWISAAPFFVGLLQLFPQIGSGLPMSWQMRLEIWQFTQERILEKPLFGWGLDASRSFHDQYLAIGDFRFFAIPLHPHNAALQIWLETGALGAIACAACIAVAGFAAATALSGDRARTAALAGVIATITTIWSVSYGAWQEWWMAMPFAAAALVLVGRPPSNR